MKRLVLLLPVAAGILFGAAGVFVRKLNAFGMDNITVLFVRVLFASLALLLVILIQDRNLLKIRLTDVPVFCGTGLLGILGLNLCYNEAIGRLPLSLAAVLLSTSPIFVMLMAEVLFHEKITIRKAGCMLLAIIGCILASGLPEQAGGADLSLSGILLGVGAAVFYALYSIFSRKATDKGYHTYTVIFYSVFFITLVVLPFSSFDVIGRFVAAAPLGHTLFLILHALCISVLPYIFLTLALRRAEAGQVSILAAGGEPIAAAGFGLLFYAETPTPLMLAGILITITALTLLCIRPKAR